MNKILAALIAALALAQASPANAASSDLCETLFAKADINSDGKVGGAEIVPYLAVLETYGIKPEVARKMIVTTEQFVTSCRSYKPKQSAQKNN